MSVGLEGFYALAGAFLVAIGLRSAAGREDYRRWGSALFWTLLGLSFALGRRIPPVAMGYVILTMALLAAFGLVRYSPRPDARKAERIASAARLGNRIFYPALLIPLTAIAGSLVLGRIRVHERPLVDPPILSVFSVSLGAFLALAAALQLTRSRPMTALEEGGRLLRLVGWALVLPQLLAALGGIFALAGVGTVVAALVSQGLPTGIPAVAVAAYCLGMALFTICMGNAFAAFAVMTGGIGLPLIVTRHGGNPAIMAAVGMLSGYCGTLLTPLAANFNLVPAMLLELDDKNGVIRAQVPLALALLAFNVALMECCVYRF